MVVVGRSNPTVGNVLVNLFLPESFLSDRRSVRFAYRENLIAKPKLDQKWTACLLSLWGTSGENV